MKTTDERTSPSSPLGDKVVPAKPMSPDSVKEQWAPASTPGYVRSSTTGAVKPSTLIGWQNDSFAMQFYRHVLAHEKLGKFVSIPERKT